MASCSAWCRRSTLRATTPSKPVTSWNRFRDVSTLLSPCDRWNTPGVTESIRVLYVEDDERLARLTMEYLTSHGLEVHLVPRGDLAVADVMRIRPDVVLLDLMLPGVDGFEMCKQLRARSDVPIIMVTARLEEADRVRGLEGGADDYVTKPFQSRELLARIRAQARRSRGEVGPKQERIEIGPLVIEPVAMSVTLRGEPVVLTANEFALDPRARAASRSRARSRAVAAAAARRRRRGVRSLDRCRRVARAREARARSEESEVAEDRPRRRVHARTGRSMTNRRLATRLVALAAAQMVLARDRGDRDLVLHDRPASTTSTARRLRAWARTKPTSRTDRSSRCSPASRS